MGGKEACVTRWKVLACLLATPLFWVGAASAADGSSSESPHPPAHGHWRISRGTDHDVNGGSFRVTRDHRYVTHLKVETWAYGCGNQTVTVTGKHRIHHAE